MIEIVYDGDCPFCTRYVTLVNLRKTAGEVRLINARDEDPILGEIKHLGLDINRGMVARVGNIYFYGDEVLTLLATHSCERGVFNRITRWAFKKPTRAKWIYPIMVKGRNIVLRLLGRKPIVL